MTDTKTPSPSDAEIVALLGDPKYSTIGAVREAVARWGQPQAVEGGELVACTYGDNGYACCEGGPCQAELHNEKIAAPPPQAVREPLTPEQIAEGFANRSRSCGLFAGGVLLAEQYHGITKGGQHGAE